MNHRLHVVGDPSVVELSLQVVGHDLKRTVRVTMVKKLNSVQAKETVQSEVFPLDDMHQLMKKSDSSDPRPDLMKIVWPRVMPEA